MGRTPLADVADWLVTIGYPFDFRVDPPPPPELCQAIEEAWVRKDGGDGYDDDIRATVADEGGWLYPNRTQPVTCPYIVGGTTKHCTLAETRVRDLETRLALAERVARIYTGRETATLIDTDTAVAEWLAEVNE